MAHTEGKWLVTTDRIGIGKPHKVEICVDEAYEVTCGCYWVSFAREVDDAALIAAAPQMLEALESFVTAHERCLQLEKTDVALRMAKAAIAAARGEA